MSAADRTGTVLETAKSVGETGVGAALFTLPFWHHMVSAISEIAGLITAVTGALIGLHGVWRIFRRYLPVKK